MINLVVACYNISTLNTEQIRNKQPIDKVNMMKNIAKNSLYWCVMSASLMTSIAIPLTHAADLKAQKPLDVNKTLDTKQPVATPKQISPAKKIQQLNNKLTNQAQQYTATFSNKLKLNGMVTIGATRWQCNSTRKQCVVNQVKKALGVQDCQKLAQRQNQQIRQFGSKNKAFSLSQVNQCNAVIRAKGTTSASKTIAKHISVNNTNLNNTAKNPRVKPTKPTFQANSAAKVIQFNKFKNQIAQKTRIKVDLTRDRLNPKGGHGKRFTGNDCNDNRRDANPSLAEVCDHIDNDCDGQIDEGQTIPYYLDADGDNHGDPNRRVAACPIDVTNATDNGEWLVRVGNDCDDTDPTRWLDCQ